MRFRLLALSAIVTAASLVACSSGGSSIPSTGGSGSGGSGATGGTPSGTASQAIVANDPTSTTIATASGLTVTIPANTFATATTVTVNQYATATGLPAAAQSQNRRTAQGRVRALSAMPAGATFLAGFSIGASGSALAYQAIGVSESFTASVPSGDVVRVAKFGANGYTDVDTATVSGSSASNDKNVQYVSVSTGGSAQPYIFYAIASPAAPAAITVSVQQEVQGQSLVPGGSLNFYATGSDANGNYLPFTATFSASPSAMATAAQTAIPNVGLVTAAASLGSVTVTATDPRTTASGSVSASILASRPGASGDTFTFTGTLNRTDVYTYPQSAPGVLPVETPLPTTNVTATVTQTVTAEQTANPFMTPPPNGTEFVTSETDTYPTQTFGTTTESFYSTLPLTTVPGQYQLYGTATADDAGNQWITSYSPGGPYPNPTNNPLTVDELPEVSGASWTNSPASTYVYFGADSECIAQQTNSDGSYNADQIFSGVDAPVVVIQTNPDFSASYAVEELGLGPNTYAFTFPAPVAGIINVQENEYPAGTSPTPVPNTSPLPVPVWYPTTNGLYSETDVDNGSVAIPASCKVPAAFMGAANQLQQQITQIDPALGTITTTTTTQYVLAGFGPVCDQVQSEVKEFYDYNNDTPYTWFFAGGPTPLQDTKITETLTLASANGSDVNTAASSRKGLGTSGQTNLSLKPISVGAFANARAQIAFINQRDRVSRIKNFKAFVKKLGTARMQFKEVK